MPETHALGVVLGGYGEGALEIAVTFVSEVLNPFELMTCPKYSTEDNRKLHFSSLSRIPDSASLLKTSDNRARCSSSD